MRTAAQVTFLLGFAYLLVAYGPAINHSMLSTWHSLPVQAQNAALLLTGAGLVFAASVTVPRAVTELRRAWDEFDYKGPVSFLLGWGNATRVYFEGEIDGPPNEHAHAQRTNVGVLGVPRDVGFDQKTCLREDVAAKAIRVVPHEPAGGSFEAAYHARQAEDSEFIPELDRALKRDVGSRKIGLFRIGVGLRHEDKEPKGFSSMSGLAYFVDHLMELYPALTRDGAVVVDVFSDQAPPEPPADQDDGDPDGNNDRVHDLLVADGVD